jgi:hypothetical protein
LREWPGEAAGEVEKEFGEGFRVEGVMPRGRRAKPEAEATEEQGGDEGEENVAAYEIFGDKAEGGDGGERGSEEEAGAHADEGEESAEESTPPAEGKGRGGEEEVKGEEREAGEEIELGLKSTEDVFPSDRWGCREEEDDAAGEGPRQRESAEGPEEKSGGEGGVEGGAGDALDPGVPLAAAGGEGEIEGEGGSDAVFVVRKNEIFPEFVAFEPRSQEEIALLGPLVPIREVAAVAVDGDQFGAPDGEEECADEGEVGGVEGAK